MPKHYRRTSSPSRASRVRASAIACDPSGTSTTSTLGWELYEAGDFTGALEAFERALRARERDPANASAIAIAQYAVGKTLRALGRPGEAIPLLEKAVAWAAREGAPDGWFHEELAEEYAALGDENEAREQARLALPLLLDADPSFAEDADRASRLRQLTDMAGGTDDG